MIDQIFIGLFGVTSIFLANCKRESLRRFAPLFGAASQPFWFYTTWTHGQYGIFALTFLYATFWLKGIWHSWIEPWLDDHDFKFCATYDGLGMLGWKPCFRYSKHLLVWKRSLQCYTAGREIYVIAFNWQLHWVWRVTF